MHLTLIEIIFAAQLGGFAINYLADVLPRTRKLGRAKWWPLSSQSIRSYFSIPRVQIVQIIFLLLAFWLRRFSIPDWNALTLLFVLSYFGLVIVIDIEHRAILHQVSIAGSIIFLILRGSADGLENSLVGGLAGFVILLAIYWLGNQMTQWIANKRGERLEEEALGFGDVILAGVIGLLLGWPGIIAGLFLGLFLAGIYSALLILWQLLRGKYQAYSSIPLGPFLSLGAISAILLKAYV